MTLTTIPPSPSRVPAQETRPLLPLPPLPPLPPERLLAIVRGLGPRRQRARRALRAPRSSRTLAPSLVVERASSTSGSSGWHAHQGVELHDHGGSAGAFAVVEGQAPRDGRRVNGTDVLLETFLGVGSARALRAGPRPLGGEPERARSRRACAGPAPAAARHDGLLRSHARSVVLPCRDRSRRRGHGRTWVITVPARVRRLVPRGLRP